MRHTLPASPARVLSQMVVAVILSATVSAVALIAIDRVEWPAYNSSNQLHALTTVGQVAALAGIFAAGWLWRRGRRVLARVTAVAMLSALSVVTLAMPLGATKLYLFGISVDQQFRTEYLTRLADSPALHDMTYQGLPPYYPPGWFWIGGRLAALTGTPAWEMYKPWAIVSITAACAVAFVLWKAMIRFEVALVVTTATAVVTLAYTSTEPYAAVITVLLPPVFVLAWSGLGGKARNVGWGAVLGVAIFLGAAALTYTLLLAYAAFTIALMALVLTVSRRSLDPLLRLVVVGVLSGAIALIGWGPWLLAAAKGTPADTGTAQHYLPDDAAVLTFPMFQTTLLGALCLLGTVWLVMYARSSTRAGALTVGVVAVYLWSLLSMLTTLAGTTLLSFRLQPTLTVLLAAAGAFGFIAVTQAVAARYQHPGRHLVAVAATVGAIGAVTFTQDVPDVLRSDITVAYTDTDGYGLRADRRPPGSEQYYREIDARIQQVTGRPRHDTVVMTADYSFLSYYPYYGFQGLTSHYANPLAQFKERSAAIESWALFSKPDQLIGALDSLPWAPPTVFLMRRGGPDSYTLRLAADVYPNQPNVKRYQVELNAAIFDDPRWDVSTAGPFTLAIRR
ncbi:transmembrane protein [Mycolicibacterium canariasense]|uniref:Galactan 5-O-arabinofuranosyltransferase n=1 Tax=Mycolicibacterium canariasense TaxID=228230 RepID=A0A117ICE5_MYCCR|nr:galactan 5-O-arabinofuranosyltransferase [Mycolicibacterium canariasense]MCV7207318.1 galactan 5-O-arabinofuranosyltransferase [Mycolicibacterium canariasense]GAS99425.1 transmembrane protein [Mycolicibacterium canariasense]